MTVIRFGLGLFSCLALLSSTGCTTPSGPTATAYDLRIDASLTLDQSLQKAFLFVVTPAPSTTPAPAGSQITVQGSLTFSQGPQPTNTPTLANWTCTGPWSSFQCSRTLAAPLNNDGGYLLITYAPPPPGTNVTYTVSVNMAGNNDPDPTTDTYSFTHGV